MGYAQGALRDSVEEVHGVQQELVIQTEESARGPPR